MIVRAMQGNRAHTAAQRLAKLAKAKSKPTSPPRPKKAAPLRSLAQSERRPPEVERAAKRFDVRQHNLVGRVERLQTTLERDPTHLRAEACHDVAVLEVYRHRFVVPEHCLAGKFARIEAREPKRKAKKAWRLEESIWAPRARRSDSKAFLDTDECERRRFESDWVTALDSKLLVHIRRTDEKEKGGGTRGSVRGAGAPSAEERNHPEVLEVREVLWEHHDTLYHFFYHYASLLGEDPFSMNLLAYERWCEDCKFAVKGSVGCQTGHLDQLFVAVNASNVGSGKVEKHNKQNSLNRQEFLQVLVRIATARYVLTGRTNDVSDAVRMLVEDDILANAPNECLHDLNVFRERFCYLEEVDEVLRRHEDSLRALYKEFSRDKDDKGAKGSSKALSRSSLMGYDEWVFFCNALKIFDSETCSPRHGTYCFIWSRMAVVGNEDDDAVRVKMVHLYFEDFLEALVRLSTMKGWPTDEEISKAGYTDAGEFLINLQQFPTVYAKFAAEHAQSWDQEPRQPIARCVEHLISWLVRVVEGAAGPSATLPSPSSRALALTFGRSFSRASRRPPQAPPQART